MPKPLELRKVIKILKRYGIVYMTGNILVCLNCGEGYYDRKAMKKIEDIRDKVKHQDLEIEELGKVMRAHAA